jgi:hypothetical protein
VTLAVDSYGSAGSPRRLCELAPGHADLFVRFFEPSGRSEEKIAKNFALLGLSQKSAVSSQASAELLAAGFVPGLPLRLVRIQRRSVCFLSIHRRIWTPGRNPASAALRNRPPTAREWM